MLAVRTQWHRHQKHTPHRPRTFQMAKRAVGRDSHIHITSMDLAVAAQLLNVSLAIISPSKRSCLILGQLACCAHHIIIQSPIIIAHYYEGYTPSRSSRGLRIWGSPAGDNLSNSDYTIRRKVGWTAGQHGYYFIIIVIVRNWSTKRQQGRARTWRREA